MSQGRNPASLRTIIAGIVKDVLQARGKAEVGFLTTEIRQAWKLDDLSGTTHTVRSLLSQAHRNLDTLLAPGRSSASAEETAEDRAFDLVERFLEPQNLKDAVEQAGSGIQDWNAVARWDLLGALRDALDALPEEADDEAEVVSTNECRRSGDVWSVRFAGEKGHFSDAKGFQYIARLLATPNRGLSVFELTNDATPARSRSIQSQSQLDMHESDFVGPPRRNLIIDKTAERGYRRRLNELQTEIAEARLNNDLATQLRLEDELVALNSELSRLRRTFQGADQRAIDNVRKALKRAYAVLDNEHMGSLAEHLRRSIQKHRNSYSYAPGRDVPEWGL